MKRACAIPEIARRSSAWRSGARFQSCDLPTEFLYVPVARDFIPSLDDPAWDWVRESTPDYLEPDTRVIGVLAFGQAWAIPHSVLWHHEIVNFVPWGPTTIFVDGEEVVPMIGGHTMFSEQARGADGRIVKDGQIYSPMVSDKEGFANPQDTEFHFVAHTTEPDQENFPPHTAWIHLHFSDVEVLQKPEGSPIPHTAGE